MKNTTNKKEISSKQTQCRNKTNVNRSKPAAKQPNDRSLAYSIYLNSLGPNGRSAMASLLNKVPSMLGSKSAPERYQWSQLSYQKLQEVRAHMQLEGYSPNTINQALSALKGVANAAFNLEQIGADQLMRVRSIKAVKGSVQKPGRILTKKEVRFVKKVLTKDETLKAKRNLALFQLGIGGGLRCAELVNITVGDVNLGDGRIRITRGKGSKYREVFIGPEVVNALTVWIDELEEPVGALFRRIAKNDVVLGDGLTTNGVRCIIASIANSAGIDTFTTHDLRRSYGTELLRSGVDVSIVSRLMGHSNVNTTCSSYDLRGKEELRAASQLLRY